MLSVRRGERCGGSDPVPDVAGAGGEDAPRRGREQQRQEEAGGDTQGHLASSLPCPEHRPEPGVSLLQSSEVSLPVLNILGLSYCWPGP